MNPMSTNSQHVVPNFNGGWSVRRHGSTRATRVFASQSAAVAYARGRARKERTDLFVHRGDGTVKEMDSYRPGAFPAVKTRQE